MKKRAGAAVTILDLVKSVQDTAGSDSEAVAVLTHLFETRRVLYPRSDSH